MATYVTTVASTWSAEQAFAYLSDMSTFADWDPGVQRVAQVAGKGPGPDAAYDVTVKGIVGTLVMRYRTLDHSPPRRVVLRADTALLSSLDEIVVEPTPSGCTVTYDAELTMRGPLRLADPLLGKLFDRIGDRAAAGLARVLTGEVVVR